MASTLLTLYYFFSMLAHVRPEKRRLIHFIGPFALLFSQFWDEQGNRARVRTVIFASVFGLCIGALTILFHIPVPEAH